MYASDSRWQNYKNMCSMVIGSFSPDPSMGALENNTPMAVKQLINLKTQKHFKDIELKEINFNSDGIEIVGHFVDEEAERRFSVECFYSTSLVYEQESRSRCEGWIQKRKEEGKDTSVYLIKQDPNLCGTPDYVMKRYRENKGKNHLVVEITYCVFSL